MRHVLGGVLVVASGLLVDARPGDAAEAMLPMGTGRPTLVVRTYTAPDSERDLPVAHRTAAAILERAGIEVGWLECAVAAVSPSAAACREPLRGNELVVRIVRAGAAYSRDAAELGFALVDVGAGAGSLATVFADRVGQLALRAGANAAELLGRAIAHELGHLLLGHQRHEARGLMRASWTHTDLRRNLPAQWLFGDTEAGVMRQAILRRGGP